MNATCVVDTGVCVCVCVCTFCQDRYQCCHLWSAPDIHWERQTNICFEFYKNVKQREEKKQLFGLMLKNMPNGWYQSQVNTLNMPILFKSSILLKPKLLQWLCNLSTKLPWVLHFYQTSPYAPLCVIALSLSGLRIIMVVFLPKVLGASFCWRKRPHDCNFISLSPALCTAALSFHCICITGQNPQRSRQNLGWK